MPSSQTWSQEDVQGLANRPRVVALADANAITFSPLTADVLTQYNTQSSGALVINAPTATPEDGQKITFSLKSLNQKTISWNAIYRGNATLILPDTTTGSNKTDTFTFQYNTRDDKYDLISVVYGTT